MSEADKKMSTVAAKFQQDMAKLGLGVTISMAGRDPVTVTTYCETHGVSVGKTCAACEENAA